MESLGCPGLAEASVRMWRSIGLGRDRQFGLAGGTLNLVPAPQLVAFNVLPAVGAGKSKISHSVRLLAAAS